MAGEPAVGNKEPRELVLAAMYQAKCLQETLNEALNIRESDIVAARANNDSANKLSSLPLYQAPMTKLMAISTSLSQQLSSLLVCYPTFFIPKQQLFLSKNSAMNLPIV